MVKQVMAIGNITPDSFYSTSRLLDANHIVQWALDSLKNGASILDIGGCSTRPGCTLVSATTEWDRVSFALSTLREAVPQAQLSLDTFRPEVARLALEQFGSMIINDISGGDESMWEIVHYWEIPYVWTLRGDFNLPAIHPERNQTNIILDPGIGFTGSIDSDFNCLRHLHTLRQYNRPILVGVSRKSMIYKPLGISTDESLTPTQVAQFYALEQGATILRTHDVKETMQTITLFELLNTNH
jgi:dihydropteroate synthase